VGREKAALPRAGLDAFVASTAAGDLDQTLVRAVEWEPNVCTYGRESKMPRLVRIA
jgi:hypothetical protein